MTKRDPANNEHFVIVGGGAAGMNCSETLRQSGFSGKITMLTSEKYAPYDRTLLSKAVSVGDASKWALRPESFLNEADIEVRTETSVFKLHADEKEVELADGKRVSFDKLMIATGGIPRKPTCMGSMLNGINVLRTREDQEAIKAKAKDAKKVVVLGGSFIGSEVAASIKMNHKDKDVTMVFFEDVPFQRTLGDKIGAMMAKEHTENGVKLISNCGLDSFKGEDGHVKKVILSNGTELEADLVVVGFGVTPATEFL